MHIKVYGPVLPGLLLLSGHPVGVLVANPAAAVVLLVDKPIAGRVIVTVWGAGGEAGVGAFKFWGDGPSECH